MMTAMNTDQESIKRIRTRVLPALERALPGTIKTVDWYFMVETSSDFITCLLTRPIDAHRILEEFFDGDKDMAKYVLRTVLREIALGRLDIADKAYECLSDGNEDCFMRTLRKAYVI